MSNPESGGDLVALVTAAKAGDRKALEALFERELPTVTRFVAIKLGQPAEAFQDEEDLVQDCMLKALKALDRFEPINAGALRSWLATIVENHLRDTHRRVARQKRAGGRIRHRWNTESLAESLFKAKGPGPSSQATQEEEEKRILLALERLPDPYREALLLRGLLRIDYNEIASRLDRRIDTCRQLVRRARDRLRKELER